ncbi:hypothetical protein KAI68_07150 [bacterium]|nr:hypothetical protein [bacterium]
MKLMYLVVEVNLILWGIVLGQLLFNSENVDFTTLNFTVFVGFVFAVVAQHWAYYNLYKKNKIKTG